jgi:hypothetical protein
MDRAYLDLPGAFRFMASLTALVESQRALVLGMSRSLLRRLGAFVAREAGSEDSIWRLGAFCEKAQELLAKVNAGLVHPRNFFFHLLAFITDDFADWTSPPEPRELMEIFCGCPVDSPWDD